MANYIYGAISLTGGGTGALDRIDGDDLQDQDAAIVFTASGLYTYTLDADLGGTEDSPSLIVPDTNAGSKRWVLIPNEAFNVSLATGNFDGLLSGSEDTLQKVIDKLDDIFNSADFSVAAGVASLDDDVGKGVATQSGTATPSSHQITMNGAGRLSTAASGATVTITLANLTIVIKSGAYVITTADDIVIGDTSGGGFTLTMPAAADKDMIRVVKKSADYILTVQRGGSDTIEGNTSFTMAAENAVATLISDGVSTWSLSNDIIDTSEFDGILSGTDDDIQKCLETLDDMFDGSDFSVAAGVVTINEAGIDHGGLSGRDDDDHTLYSLANGTRDFSGGVKGVTPTDDAHLATKGYVDGVVQGLDWQVSVLDRTNEAGATETVGFRYISTETSGTWTIHNLYEWNGSSWDEVAASEGMAAWVEDENVQYVFNGTTWVKLGATITHENLNAVNSGTYRHLSATQVTDLTDAGDSTLHYHASDRNLANASGVLPNDTTHGTRGGGTQHSAATTSVNGFMSSGDKTKLDGVATGATNLALGETLNDAYRGDRGKTAYDHVSAATGAEHGATSSNTPNMIVRRDGSGNFSCGVVDAVATGARYSDLAEKYKTLDEYIPGTVVSMSDLDDVEAEICEEDCSPYVLGVISTDPGFKMNSEGEGQFIALTGRVPTRIIGPVKKKDILVSAGNGCARAIKDPSEMICKIGYAIETNLDAEEKLVECVIK